MNKLAAKILLLFSGALLLVLSVLPHHHHGDIIHFGVMERCEPCQECRENARQGEWDIVAHKHHHSSDESDADCDLRQLFVISAREEQLLPIYHGNQTEPSWSPTLPYVSDLFSSYCLPQNDTPNNLKYPPLIERLRSIAARHIFALRAPPAIIA